jgi:hypothetical protein
MNIVKCIWGPGITFDSHFYSMINMNKIGLSLCRKTKGIGTEGVSIVCEKFYEYP